MENIKIINILDDLKNNNQNLNIDIDSLVNYSESDYISDVISELADSNIDLYTSDLLDWLKDNYDIVQQANEEFGTSEDIIKQCQQGQYYQYNNEMYENLEDYIKLYAYDYLLNTLHIEEITKTQYEELESELKIIDSDSTIGDISDKVNKILEVEKETE